MPTSFQQQSFTALVCVAFALKVLDIIHLIFRQSNTDLFFIDWEKPKAGIQDIFFIKDILVQFVFFFFGSKFKFSFSMANIFCCE